MSESEGDPGSDPVDLLFVLPPAKVSNEIDMFRSAPGVEVATVDAESMGREATFPLPVRRIPFLGSPERWSASVAWYPGLPALDPGAVDVVASVELYGVASVQAGRLARRIGKPHAVVVWEVLDKSPLYLLPPWREFAREVASSADAFICLSETARRHAIARGVEPLRTVVVEPGVSLEQFRPAASRQTDPVAVFLGELRPDKGILDVIAAADLVADSLGPTFELIVIGDGPLRRDVDEAARSRPWLKALGRVPRGEVPDVLSRSAAMILAPYARRLWAEQFGYALVEGMACGLPIVATRSGVIPDVVPSPNVLVAERDVAGLAEGLRWALGPLADEAARLNPGSVAERFSLERQADRLGEVLAEIVSSGGVGATPSN